MDPSGLQFCAYYSNYAWGAVQRGYRVDAGGRLSTFDHSAGPQAPLQAGQWISRADLEALTGDRVSFKESLAADELERWRRLGSRAAVQEPGEPRSICADAGTYAYAVLVPEGEGFRIRFVYQTGDWRRIPAPADAEELKGLMVQRALRHQIAFELVPGGPNWCSGM